MILDTNQASIREACDNGVLAGAVTLVWQGGKVLQVNEIGEVTIELQQPLPVEPYASNRVGGALIVVDPASNRTSGALLVRSAG